MSFRRILELLIEKKNLFVQFELATEPMLIGDVDECEQCMEIRTRCMEKIEAIDGEIGTLIVGQVPLRRALNHDCSREELPSELRSIYDASFEVKAVANRLLKNSDGILMHLEDEKQRITDKIEEISQSGSSVAGHYYDSVRMGGTRSSYPSMRKKI